MKYIDADLLRKEIESRMGDCDANSKNPNQLLWAELAALIPFIDSLQQEQQKQKKKCNDCPHCVDRKDQNGWHFKGCFGGPYKGKFIAEIDECPLEQEQQEVDLEKVVMIDNVIMNMTAEGYNNGYKTRPFYEEVLRRFNARKEEKK